MDGDSEELHRESFCYLTTTGRASGRPHTIEIWFGLAGSVLYMLSGGGERSDWVRNLIKEQNVKVRIGGREFSGSARPVSDISEDALARSLLLEKYEPSYSGDLSDWGRSALPIAIDLEKLGG